MLMSMATSERPRHEKTHAPPPPPINPNQTRAGALEEEVVLLRRCLNDGGEEAKLSRQNAVSVAKMKNKCLELQVCRAVTPDGEPVTSQGDIGVRKGRAYLSLALKY